MYIPIKLHHNPRETIRSHGWVLLAPFDFDDDRLTWAMNLPQSGPTLCRLELDSNSDAVILVTNQKTSEVDVEAQISAVRRMFRADEDFSEFWKRIQQSGSDELLFVSENRAGALLRAPTLFEDLAKTMLTVNCSWANTKTMVSNLCQKFGNPIPHSNTRTCPVAAKLASSNDEELREIGLGFRSKFLHKVSVVFANNSEIEKKWESESDYHRLREEIVQLPGVGPYVTNHMLMMLGHYSQIPADSTTREFLGIPARSPRNAADLEVHRRFKQWNTFAALAYHFTRKGHSARIPGN
jgi:3-methyladenine DNA glycosylase/8-oxoguanine DNA glycosylase